MAASRPAAPHDPRDPHDLRGVSVLDLDGAEGVLVELWWGDVRLSAEHVEDDVTLGEGPESDVFLPSAVSRRTEAAPPNAASSSCLVKVTPTGRRIHVPPGGRLRDGAERGEMQVIEIGDFSLRITPSRGASIAPRAERVAELATSEHTRRFGALLIATLVHLGVLAAARHEADTRPAGARQRDRDEDRILMFQLLVDAHERETEFALRTHLPWLPERSIEPYTVEPRFTRRLSDGGLMGSMTRQPDSLPPRSPPLELPPDIALNRWASEWQDEQKRRNDELAQRQARKPYIAEAHASFQILADAPSLDPRKASPRVVVMKPGQDTASIPLAYLARDHLTEVRLCFNRVLLAHPERTTSIDWELHRDVTGPATGHVGAPTLGRGDPVTQSDLASFSSCLRRALEGVDLERVPVGSWRIRYALEGR